MRDPCLYAGLHLQASHAAELVKFLLSNVYLNITKEPACQSPADGQTDMLSCRRCRTLC